MNENKNHSDFNSIKNENIRNLGESSYIRTIAYNFIKETAKYRYSYNFSWMGRPIIQFPQDLIALQEIIWRTQPDLIIETGIAHGGSLLFYASMLELIGGNGIVLGIDIDIRENNRIEINKNSLSNRRIRMLEGSSVEKNIVKQVNIIAEKKTSVMVCLDSMHTHAHVLKELEYYSPLVTKGSYIVVFDTAIEDMPEGFFPNRPWGKGNNPKTAVWEFLKNNKDFEIDKSIQDKLQITVAPDGWLRRVS